MEDQFIEALEHKKVSGFKGHSGLGFHQEAEKKEEQKEEKKEESAGSDDKTESKSESKDSKQEEQKVQKHKLEEQEETKDMTDPKKKKFMMNFVKSSTWCFIMCRYIVIYQLLVHFTLHYMSLILHM